MYVQVCRCVLYVLLYACVDISLHVETRGLISGSSFSIPFYFLRQSLPKPRLAD